MNLISNHPLLTSVIENLSFSLEIIAVAIITLSIIFALISLVKHMIKHDPAKVCIGYFKKTVGKGIQIALELLIAADIINTVVLSATLENVAVLAILVLIRTFLSWTLVFETDGHWPFQKNHKEDAE